jgi:hypothetical protein
VCGVKNRVVAAANGSHGLAEIIREDISWHEWMISLGTNTVTNSKAFASPGLVVVHDTGRAIAKLTAHFPPADQMTQLARVDIRPLSGVAALEQEPLFQNVLIPSSLVYRPSVIAVCLFLIFAPNI